MHIIDTCFAAQSKLFEKLLSEALQSPSLVGPSLEELERPCSTLIMRPEGNLVQALGLRIAEMADLFPGQVYYGAPNLHMTISALPDVVPGSILHRHLRRSLASHVGALRTFRMPLVGFGIIGSAVIIKAIDSEGQLGRLVRCLVADLEEEGFAVADLANLHTKIFWITAARLTEEPSPGLIDYICSQQNEDFGVADFGAMELVSTNSLFGPEVTRVIEKFSLADFS